MHTEKLNDNNEMTLSQWLYVFYQYKKSILFSTLLFVTIGLIYILVSSPIYQASAYISAPTEGDIVGFNKGNLWSDNNTIKPVSVKLVYATFSKELLAVSNKKSFFKKYYLPLLKQQPEDKATLKKLYEAFSKQFSIKINNNVAPTQYEIDMRATNPELAANWIKQFIELVKENTVKMLLNDIEKQRSVVIYQLTHQIHIISKVAKENRFDHMIRLREALKIAQAANISSSLVQYNSANESNMAYMLGANVLQAQIKNLSERKSDNEFIPELRKLQSRLDFYSSFVIDPKDVAVFSSDGAIEIPAIPVSQKKGLIIITSLLLGLIFSMLGVMIYFTIRFNKAI